MRKKKKFDIDSLNNHSNTIAKITIILREMEEVALEAGIPKIKYHYAIKNLDKKSEEYQEQLFNWMVQFYNNEYKEASIMWNKMSPHGWRNLKELLGIHDQPEQIILQDKFKQLRTAWFGRPRPPKKLKEVK